MTTRWALDVSVRRSRDGLVLTGGRPRRLVRLSPAGAAALDAALAGAPVDGQHARALLDRLAGGELLHPVGPPAPVSRGSISFVVPVHDGAGHIGPLVRALTPYGPVIVVDDRSSDGSAQIACASGAIVLANSGPPGPSAARNTGLEATNTPLVAFVDSDCQMTDGWLEQLVWLFDDDPRLAVASPRVRTVPGASRLARYELTCSPLDLGAHPGLVAPGRRLTYAPAATIVTRRSALVEIGGFAPELTVGEDVDLLWRLVERGWRVRYAPHSAVEHHPRASLRAFARQRMGYGRSAAALERQHPGAAVPVRAAPETMAIWASYALLGPVAAAGALLGGIALGAAGASRPDLRRSRARAVASGHLHASRHLLRVLVREWLPLTVLASARWSRARRVAAIALAVDAAASGAGRRVRIGPVSQIALRALDNGAYSAGIWRAAAAERSAAALAVRTTSTSAARRRRRPARCPQRKRRL
jgi:mycofactocin glycosyltransferase